MTLAPCPFCGATDAAVENIMGAAFSVWCNACHASGPLRSAKTKHAGKWASDAAKEAWNRRAVAPAEVPR